MAGERSVAYYSLGNRLVIAIQSLTAPVTQAVFPRASLLFSTDPAAAWRLVGRVCALLLPAIGVGCLGMVAAAPLIVHLFGGAEYAASVSIMRIMAPVPLLVTAAAILAQTVMVNLGLTKSLLWVYLAVGLLNLATLPVLVHFAGANGAAVSLTLSEALGPLLMLWVLRRRHLLPSGAAVSAIDGEKYSP
jgi:O-antigen/teichoic acid export membrane protein